MHEGAQMPDHLLPIWMCRLIPFIYMGSGIYIWVKLDMAYALISGAMMYGAGVLVLFVRQQGPRPAIAPDMGKRET